MSSALTPTRFFVAFACIAIISVGVRAFDVASSVNAFDVLQNRRGQAETSNISFENSRVAQALQDISPAAGDPEPPETDVASEDPAEDMAEEQIPEDPVVALEDTILFTDEGDIADWQDPNDQDPAFFTVRQDLFDELARRRKALDDRENALELREALLKTGEKELNRKLEELNNLRAELDGLLNRQTEEEKERIASLVKVYENMKPKDAARIFDTLDLDILMDVTEQMSERKLSPVLAAMNAERARTITVMLAEQKKLPSLPAGAF